MAWENPKTNWGQPGQTVPGVDDFNRIEGNIDILGKYDRAPGYGTATGENNKTISLSPAPGSYYDGLCFAFKNATQNTGAVTINVNGMGAKPIKKPNGNDLAAGNLKAGSIYTVRYNGTNFILQGSDSAGNATPEHVLAGKTFSNDTDTELTGTMPNRDAVVITPGTVNQIIPEGYHNGNGYVKGDANLIPDNIAYDKTIFGVQGNKYTIPYNYILPSQGEELIISEGEDYEYGDQVDTTQTLLDVTVSKAGQVRIGIQADNDGSEIYSHSRVSVYHNDSRIMYLDVYSPWYDYYYYNYTQYEKTDAGQSNPKSSAWHFRNVSLSIGDTLRIEFRFNNDNDQGVPGNGDGQYEIACGNGATTEYINGLS